MNLFTLDFAKIRELTQFWLLHRPTWILAIDFIMTGASSGQLLAPVPSHSQGWALKGQSLLSSRGHFLDPSSGSFWASNTQRTDAKLHSIIPLSLQDFPSKAPLPSPLHPHRPPATSLVALPFHAFILLCQTPPSSLCPEEQHPVCLLCCPHIDSRRGREGLFLQDPSLYRLLGGFP